MEIIENVSLKEYSSFKIGGNAKFFCIAKNNKDVLQAIGFAKENNLNVLPIGGASNILFSDAGFDGLVIKIKGENIDIIETNNFDVAIKVSCGILLAKLLDFAKDNNLTGLEWAIGIPGTLGGAIVGNAGTKNGQTISDCINNVSVVSILDIQERILKKDDCKFEYRKSIFKGNNDYALIDAEIVLKKSESDTINSLCSQNLDYRIKTQPFNFPSAGSIFKNPANDSAGRLIEECGLKGKQIGGAKVSEIHANFIVNTGNATAGDVLELIDIIKKSVKEKFNINLEEEIEIF